MFRWAHTKLTTFSSYQWERRMLNSLLWGSDPRATAGCSLFGQCGLLLHPLLPALLTGFIHQ